LNGGLISVILFKVDAMFVPKATSSLRSSRRRQRTSSGESIKQHKAKRQRSTQENVESELENDRIERDYQRESVDLGVSESDKAKPEATENTGAQKQIAIRGPKKSEKRDVDNDIDGAVVLVCPSIFLYPLGYIRY